METQTEGKNGVRVGEVMREAAPLVEREPREVRAADLDPMAIIEQRNRAMERLLEYAIRSTTPEQWTDQGGKPYLTAGGAQAVARRCGVKTTDVECRREAHQDEEGTYFEYVFTGTFSLPGAYDRIEGVIGSCISRDSFLGTGSGKSLSEMDPGDVRKKARSNLDQRGVTALLGLRGLEWSTLAKYGITPDGAQKVEYKAGAKGGGHSNGSGFTFAFGKNKGKAPADVDEKDLRWYADAFKASLADPDKAKFKANNEKGLAAVEAEIARRANKDAGTAPTGAQQPSLWARICAIAQDLGIPAPEVGPVVKKTTGKANANQLVEADLVTVKAALEQLAKGKGEDIQF